MGWLGSCVVARVVHKTRQEISMTRFAMAVGLGAGLLLLAGQADAQWRDTDHKGASQGTPDRDDVPPPHPDPAQRVRAAGSGNPRASGNQPPTPRPREA